MTLKAVTDVENAFLTPWPLILYCIVLYLVVFFDFFSVDFVDFYSNFSEKTNMAAMLAQRLSK